MSWNKVPLDRNVWRKRTGVFQPGPSVVDDLRTSWTKFMHTAHVRLRGCQRNVDYTQAGTPRIRAADAYTVQLRDEAAQVHDQACAALDIIRALPPEPPHDEDLYRRARDLYVSGLKEEPEPGSLPTSSSSGDSVLAGCLPGIILLLCLCAPALLRALFS